MIHNTDTPIRLSLSILGYYSILRYGAANILWAPSGYMIFPSDRQINCHAIGAQRADQLMHDQISGETG
jgi:hypothetical protein